MRRINKKGNFLTDNIGSFLLALAVAMVGLYLIWAYLLHGGGNSLSAAGKCGALTGSRGECKAACDINIEVEFENVGCSGKENKCCVLRDENIRDVIIPPPYGGNTDYNFEVLSIALAEQPSGSCNYENTPTGTSDNVIECRPKLSYRIPIRISVKNSGAGEVKVSAVPVVVVSGNADLVKPVGTYVGEVVTLQPGDTGDVLVDITISSSDSKENNYLNIYPYVKCETRKCKSTDEKSRGILGLNPDASITVKFVPTTT
jgi:hypothetical protein